MLERELGPTLNGLRRSNARPSGLVVATDILVLIYSQLEQNEQLLFHVEKNRVLNRVLDTT